MMNSGGVLLFYGLDPESWLSEIESVLEEFDIPMDKWVSMALRCLLGPAILWAFNNASIIMESNWCSFSYNLLWEFDPATQPPEEEVFTVEAVVAEDDYTATSEAELVVDLLLVNSVEETDEDCQKPDTEESSGEATSPIFMLAQNDSREEKIILQGQPVVESQFNVVHKYVVSCQAQQVFDQLFNRDIVIPYIKFNRVQEGIAPPYLSRYGGDFQGGSNAAGAIDSENSYGLCIFPYCQYHRGQAQQQFDQMCPAKSCSSVSVILAMDYLCLLSHLYRCRTCWRSCFHRAWEDRAQSYMVSDSEISITKRSDSKELKVTLSAMAEGSVTLYTSLFDHGILIIKGHWCVHIVRSVVRKVVILLAEYSLGSTSKNVAASVPIHFRDSPCQLNKDPRMLTIFSKIIVVGWKIAWVDNPFEYGFGCGSNQHCQKIDVVLSGCTNIGFESSECSRIDVINKPVSFTSSLLVVVAVYLGFSETGTRKSHVILKSMRSSTVIRQLTMLQQICSPPIDKGLHFKHIVEKYWKHDLETMQKLTGVVVYRKLGKLRHDRVDDVKEHCTESVNQPSGNRQRSTDKRRLWETMMTALRSPMLPLHHINQHSLQHCLKDHYVLHKLDWDANVSATPDAVVNSVSSGVTLWQIAWGDCIVTLHFPSCSITTRVPSAPLSRVGTFFPSSYHESCIISLLESRIPYITAVGLSAKKSTTKLCPTEVQAASATIMTIVQKMQSLWVPKQGCSEDSVTLLPCCWSLKVLYSLHHILLNRLAAWKSYMCSSSRNNVAALYDEYYVVHKVQIHVTHRCHRELWYTLLYIFYCAGEIDFLALAVMKECSLDTGLPFVAFDIPGSNKIQDYLEEISWISGAGLASGCQFIHIAAFTREVSLHTTLQSQFSFISRDQIFAVAGGVYFSDKEVREGTSVLFLSRAFVDTRVGSRGTSSGLYGCFLLVTPSGPAISLGCLQQDQQRAHDMTAHPFDPGRGFISSIGLCQDLHSRRILRLVQKSDISACSTCLVPHNVHFLWHIAWTFILEDKDAFKGKGMSYP